MVSIQHSISARKPKILDNLKKDINSSKEIEIYSNKLVLNKKISGINDKIIIDKILSMTMLECKNTVSRGIFDKILSIKNAKRRNKWNNYRQKV